MSVLNYTIVLNFFTRCVVVRCTDLILIRYYTCLEAVLPRPYWSSPRLLLAILTCHSILLEFHIERFP